jgi:2-dehydropantoate 2-reductase
MRIGIVGVGAIGSVVGGLLTKAGRDVTLIDQWPAHVAAMQTVGLRLSGTCGEHLIAVKAVHLHEASTLTEPFDAVFIAVKAYDTEWAMALAVRHVRGENGVVVAVQNGRPDARVAAVAGRERTLGCVVTIRRGPLRAGPRHPHGPERGRFQDR